MIGSSNFCDAAGIRQLRRAVDLVHLAVGRRHAVQDARRRRDQVHVELAFETLLDDLHVQQAEEPAAEPEPERRRRFRLEEERRVVQPQLLQRVAQLGVLAPFDRIQPGEHHRLAYFEAGNGFGGRTRRLGDRVADLRVADGLDPGEHESDLADTQLVDGRRLRREHADLLDLVFLALGHQPDLHPRPEHAVDHAHQDDHAAIRVVPRVEDQRLQRRVRLARRRRQALDDGLEDLVDAGAFLGARENRACRRRGR